MININFADIVFIRGVSDFKSFKIEAVGWLKQVGFYWISIVSCSFSKVSIMQH